MHDEYLFHHGIKGQKWGVRRYQNEDGSLTTSGKKRYSEDGLKKERMQLKPWQKKALIAGAAVAGAAIAAYGGYKLSGAVKTKAYEVGMQRINEVFSKEKATLEATASLRKEAIKKMESSGNTNTPRYHEAVNGLHGTKQMIDGLGASRKYAEKRITDISGNFGKSLDYLYGDKARRAGKVAIPIAKKAGVAGLKALQIYLRSR